MIELTPVSQPPAVRALSAAELADCYGDAGRQRLREPLWPGQQLMAPWEIWTFDFPVEGTHLCVVFSNAARLGSSDVERVNALLCRTLRGPLRRPLKANEVLLNGADGLDWETLCRVDALHFVRKVDLDLRQRRELGTVERQRMIGQRLLQFLPFRF